VWFKLTSSSWSLTKKKKVHRGDIDVDKRGDDARELQPDNSEDGPNKNKSQTNS